MYTLKLIKKSSEHTGEVEEFYYELGNDCKITYYNLVGSKFIARVEAFSLELDILNDTDAYLINEHGKTLKVINRVA